MPAFLPTSQLWCDCFVTRDTGGLNSRRRKVADNLAPAPAVLAGLLKSFIRACAVPRRGLLRLLRLLARYRRRGRRSLGDDAVAAVGGDIDGGGCRWHVGFFFLFGLDKVAARVGSCSECATAVQMMKEIRNSRTRKYILSMTHFEKRETLLGNKLFSNKKLPPGLVIFLCAAGPSAPNEFQRGRWWRLVFFLGLSLVWLWLRKES